MIYQPMTDSQAEDAWIDAFMAYISTSDAAQASELYAYMQHLKREYAVIPMRGAFV